MTRTVPRRAPSAGASPGRAGRPQSPDDSWEKVAEWYDALASERGTEYHEQVVVPGLLRLLEVQPGDNVCDLACGQGAVTQALAREGAHVTGVDLSPRLIELASRRSQEGAAQRLSKGIRYLFGDARNVPELKSGSFHAVTCVLAAMNMEPIGPLFAEMGRLLRPVSPLPAGEGTRVREKPDSGTAICKSQRPPAR